MRKRLMRWYYDFTYKLIGLKCGPIMFRMRGEYRFIDGYGTIWRVAPTGQPDMPLSISCIERQ